jgi:hypothetical protein
MGKMPKNVLQYFKYVNQGMSKAAARKKAGLPPKKGRRKKWRPGHPLYEWQKKYGSVLDTRENVARAKPII